MEKIDVMKNHNNFIGYMMLESLGMISQELFMTIVERNPDKSCKPINVELKFNGHIVPFKKFIKYLGEIYSKEVSREAEKMMNKLIPNKIADINDKLYAIESLCQGLINEIDYR